MHLAGPLTDKAAQRSQKPQKHQIRSSSGIYSDNIRLAPSGSEKGRFCYGN